MNFGAYKSRVRHGGIRVRGLVLAAWLALSGAIVGVATASAREAAPAAFSQEASIATLALARAGNPVAMIAVARTYEGGVAAPKNEAEARRWYLMAAERGVTDAMDRLGVFYAEGIGGPKNSAKALYWSDRAWRSAPEFYPDRYPMGGRMAADRVAIFRDLQARARRSDPEAMFYLGRMVEHGQGTPENPVKAAEWYRKAADKGYLPALTALGQVMYDNTRLFDRWAEGEALVEEAAKKGDLDAMTHMGVMNDLRAGGSPQDPLGQERFKQAALWYRLAADKGGVIATGHLGRLYRWGLGVPQDHAQALRLLRLAADADHPDAMLNLAAMYEKGEGMPANVELAAHWRCLVKKRQSKPGAVICP